MQTKVWVLEYVDQTPFEGNSEIVGIFETPDDARGAAFDAGDWVRELFLPPIGAVRERFEAGIISAANCQWVVFEMHVGTVYEPAYWAGRAWEGGVGG